ncbi:hypothetical protein BAR24066_07263 [Burkholderia arboris]|uniref:Uncharacterized protein n=1 Tax=Burkholderia arboris TaxID=488730 RepID=A0A9Q9SRI6_9BURK|nr:hypothetical protein BAR24066_07263 [Burkholderia arboris]
MVRLLGRDLPTRFRATAIVAAGAYQRARCAVRAQQRGEPLADPASVREDQPRRRIDGEPGRRQRGLLLPHHAIERRRGRGAGFGRGERGPEQVRKEVQHVFRVFAGRLEVPQRGVDAAGIHADDGRRDLLQAETLPLERIVRQGRGRLGRRREQRVPVELSALHVQGRECVLQCLAGARRRQPAVGEPLRHVRRVGLIRRTGKLQPVLRVRHLVGHLRAETAGNQADRRPCERHVMKRSAQRVGVPAGGHEAQRVGHAHDTRHAGRHIFADAVSRHDGRPDAPSLPQFRPRELGRETARVGIERLQRHRATVEGIAKQRFRCVERARGAGVRHAEQGAQAQRLARARHGRRRAPPARHIGRAKRIVTPSGGGGAADGGLLLRRRAGDRALVA